MKSTEHLKQTILEHLKPGISIAIMSHIEPDGDGFCASLALQRYFRYLGFESDVVIEASHLERFYFLMEGACIRHYQKGMRYDLLLILDCNSYSRIAERAELVRTAGYSILIDHHVPENGIIAADYSFIDTTSVSVGAIIFRTFKSEIEALPEDIRIHIVNCLYTSIMNDTNNFTNANTNAEVFEISAEMSVLGINPPALYKAYFLNHKPLEMRYIGEVLSTIELHHKNRILYMLSTLDMQRRNHLTADAIMNITRWVQGVKGVEVVFYLREEEEGRYKLSLRSPNLDVNAIAVTFGGGGHRSASGANISGELADIKKEMLEKLSRAIDDNSANAGL